MATVKTEPLAKRYYCWKCVRIFALKAVEWTDENIPGRVPVEDWFMRAEIKKCPVCGEEVFSLC